ncbi:hypothetical protein PROFUN_11051 [Planoprotostelium fungivorum]|uniref:Uncharacterized protein n=1 Tax=Planoprotostelium fungivorum TaxID=1890364 RepID=A0A2P6NBM6_9EUKA|nr:hypothetical protein PROFUN_11051 [Planoprotostelium fungivorum]
MTTRFHRQTEARALSVYSDAVCLISTSLVVLLMLTRGPAQALQFNFFIEESHGGYVPSSPSYSPPRAGTPSHVPMEATVDQEMSSLSGAPEAAQGDQVDDISSIASDDSAEEEERKNDEVETVITNHTSDVATGRCRRTLATELTLRTWRKAMGYSSPFSMTDTTSRRGRYHFMPSTSGPIPYGFNVHEF